MTDEGRIRTVTRIINKLIEKDIKVVFCDFDNTMIKFNAWKYLDIIDHVVKAFFNDYHNIFVDLELLKLFIKTLKQNNIEFYILTGNKEKTVKYIINKVGLKEKVYSVLNMNFNKGKFAKEFMKNKKMHINQSILIDDYDKYYKRYYRYGGNILVVSKADYNFNERIYQEGGLAIKSNIRFKFQKN
jgi:predicted HAD superfamily phosphohydrolase YqeG